MAVEFQRGDSVEVCGTLEGFVGSYYGATVISRIGGGEFIVEYGSLLRDDMLAPLREVVAGGDLRPRPPPANVKEFASREEVDAWDNDGWWRGRVVKRWRQRKRYEVYFQDTGDQKCYKSSEVRVHVDWVDGRWECSRKGIRVFSSADKTSGY